MIKYALSMLVLAGAFGAGVIQGDSHRAAIDAALGAKERAEWQARQTAAANAAARADAAQAEKDRAEQQAQMEQRDHAKISTGDCFAGHDADRVRDLWRKPDASHRHH